MILRVRTKAGTWRIEVAGPQTRVADAKARAETSPSRGEDPKLFGGVGELKRLFASGGPVNPEASPQAPESDLDRALRV